MKIVEMRVTPVAVADPPLLSSYGLHAPYALRTVVELVSEDGITGAAETHGGERTLAHFEQARSAVIGRDAYDLARLSVAIDRLFAAPESRPAANAGGAERRRPSSCPARTAPMSPCASSGRSRSRRST